MLLVRQAAVLVVQARLQSEMLGLGSNAYLTVAAVVVSASEDGAISWHVLRAR